MFAACDPEKPCITPGTYAFLGAAAGLACVALLLRLPASPLPVCPSLTLHARSGITRITVTVVVIMFELTGALTYILPTMVRPFLSRSPSRSWLGELTLPRRLQIVVMVTKAVSDQFGGGGIADQMIKFNGYPLLENHELVFGVPGALSFL